MEIYIEKYVDYLKNIKKSSENTVASYQRDLVKFSDFYRENGTEDIRSINETNINTYVLYLEKNGKSMATNIDPNPLLGLLHMIFLSTDIHTDRSNRSCIMHRAVLLPVK